MARSKESTSKHKKKPYSPPSLAKLSLEEVRQLASAWGCQGELENMEEIVAELGRILESDPKDQHMVKEVLQAALRRSRGL